MWCERVGLAERNGEWVGAIAACLPETAKREPTNLPSQALILDLHVIRSGHVAAPNAVRRSVARLRD